MSAITRSSIELYRDCLRLIHHISPGHTPKSIALRANVRRSFEANRNLKGEREVDVAKDAAVRGLANYMIMESGGREVGLGKAMKKFSESERPKSPLST